MNLGIYVHIPFCVSKCSYCNFYSLPQLELAEDYVVALNQEIIRESDKYKQFNIDSIFIGGGTPSVLPVGAIPLIVNTIKKYYKVDADCEISIEANPNSIDYAKALEWKECGINRVSVGLQSASNRLLKIIGRAHTYLDFVNAMDTLNKVGFSNINVDIMLGLPNQKLGDVKKTLNHCYRLGVKHISAYTLILEEDTPLYNQVMADSVKLPSEAKTLNMFDCVLKYNESNDYIRYEVSNFALKDYQCRHNLNCWNMCNYVGFGCSAHSFVGEYRFNNICDVVKYISCITNNESVQEEKYQVDNNQLIEETIMLGLRTAKGVDLTKLKSGFNYDLRVIKSEEIKQLLDMNYIKISENYLSVTTKGFYVLNQIILQLV